MIETGKSIAVLPFVNISSDTSNEFFSDGITEEIINALTKIEGLKVIARTSSFSFRGKNVDVRTIGTQLGVSTVLEGSVRKHKNNVRISSQLINALDGTSIWAKSFDRELKDIFSLQDEISLHIADQIRENYGHLEINDHLVEQKDISPESYQLYLKGRYSIVKFNKDDIGKGIELFKQVIAKEKNYALAYVSIHYAYNKLVAAGLMPKAEALTEGKKYLDKAFELNPELPECHHSFGWHYLNNDWDFIKAEKHLAKAIELRPGYAEAHQKYFITLILEGKINAAYEHISTAYKLDPLAPLNNYFMAYYYYVTQQFDKSNLYFEKLFKLEPSFIVGYAIYTFSLVLQNRTDYILELAERIPDIEDAKVEKTILVALAYAKLNKKDKVTKKIKELRAGLTSESRERILFCLVYIKTILGNYEEAFKLIDDGISRKDPLITLLKVDPLLTPLHEHEEWNEKLDRIYALTDNHSLESNQKSQSGISKSEVKDMQELLDKYMETELPHLDPGLSLRQLAESLKLHPNKLSWLINEYSGKNFNEFINQHRLNTFMSKAKEDEYKNFSILGIAYESGFNSKSVFNSYFKKIVGLTPKSWLNTVK